MNGGSDPLPVWKRALLGVTLQNSNKNEEKTLNYSVYWATRWTYLINCCCESVNQVLIQTNYNERLLTILPLSLSSSSQINSTGHRLATYYLRLAVAEANRFVSMKMILSLACKQIDLLSSWQRSIKNKEAANVAQTILDVLSTLYPGRSRSFITVNIGIYSIPTDGTDADTLLKRNAEISNVHLLKLRKNLNYQFTPGHDLGTTSLAL